MLIRTEIPVDAPGIDKLLRSVFPQSSEAELVQQLREDGLLTLGVVAVDDENTVIGYAAFSPVSIKDDNLQWVGLAPVAVDVKYQKQGIGKELIYSGLDSLIEFGYAAVFTLGDPAYYGKLGFMKASEFNLSCRWPNSEEAFQVYLLIDDSLTHVSGLVSYSHPFDHF